LDGSDITVRPRLRGLYRWVWRLVSTGLAAAWMGFIYQLSSSSPADLPRLVEAFSWLGDLREVLGHLALYGVLGPLLLASLWSWMTGSNHRLRWALVAMGLGTLYGALDEIHQSFVPGRSASAFDVLVDSIGAVVGVAGTWYTVVALADGRGGCLGRD